MERNGKLPFEINSIFIGQPREATLFFEGRIPIVTEFLGVAWRASRVEVSVAMG